MSSFLPLNSFEDGTSFWGYYQGFWSYFFPDTPLTIQICTMIILMTFLKYIYKLNNKEITVLEFPLIPLATYLVSSIFMFMFMFGNGTTDWKYTRRLIEETTSYTESSTFCVIGKVGYFISMIWGSFYVFHYFSSLKSKIVAVFAFVFGSFLVLLIIAFILKIPFINRLFISIAYTAFNLVPAIDIKKVYESNNINYLNIVLLIATFLLSLSVTIAYFKSMSTYGFQFLAIIVILNLLIDASLVGYYFFLYFKFGGKEIQSITKKEDEEEDEEEEKKDLVEEKIENTKDGEEKVDDEKGINDVNDYKPPDVGDDEKREESKDDKEINEEKKEEKEDDVERVY